MTRSTVISGSLLLILTTACAEGVNDDLDFDGGIGGGGAGEGGGENDGEEGEDDGSEYDPPEGEGFTCGSFAVSVGQLPTNVMLVLDKSGSMIQNSWDHDGDPGSEDITRWNSLYQVVDSIVGGFDEGIRFGATLFPSMEAGTQPEDVGNFCLVSDTAEVAVGDETAEEILGAIPGAEETGFGGATPAAAGIQTAVESLLATDHDGPKVMVLVTDGAANCAPGHKQDFKHFDDRLITRIADARAAGIPTYVVGIDIERQQPKGEIDTFTKLTLAAEAGGVARGGNVAFYNAQSHTELQAALDDITAKVECSVEAPILPSASWLIDVTVGDQEFGRVADCDTENGWMLSGGTYDLCGSACDLYAAGESFEVHYGCPPEG